MDAVTPESDKPYVYKLAYENGIVFYIGKGTNGRINMHEWEAKQEDAKQYNLYKSRIIRKIWKNGEEVVKTIIAYFDTDEDAHAYEIALIFFMRPYGNLANIADGGEGVSGYVASEETRQKLSEALKGRTLSEEHKQRISKAGNGRVFSEETKQRISKAKHGHEVSEETKQRISKAKHGHEVSEETRQKLSEALRDKPSNRKGVILSEETKQRISKAKENISEETKQKLRAAWLIRKARMKGKD